MLELLRHIVHNKDDRQLYFMCLLYRYIMDNTLYCPRENVTSCTGCKYTRGWREICYYE